MYLEVILRADVFIIFILTTQLERGSGENVTAHYLVHPEVGLKGLPCLARNVEYYRTVRVDNTSTICEMLEETWNRNPVFYTGFIYMQMVSYYTPFPETNDIAISIPEDFHVGHGIDVALRTEEVPSQRIKVFINDFKANTSVLRIQFRPGDNSTYLTSEMYDETTREIVAPLPTFEANSSYTISVYLQVWHWEVLVDGIPFKNFTHVHPFFNKGQQKVRYLGDDVKCTSIIFRLP